MDKLQVILIFILSIIMVTVIMLFPAWLIWVVLGAFGVHVSFWACFGALLAAYIIASIFKNI